MSRRAVRPFRARLEGRKSQSLGGISNVASGENCSATRKGVHCLLHECDAVGEEENTLRPVRAHQQVG